MKRQIVFLLCSFFLLLIVGGNGAMQFALTIDLQKGFKGEAVKVLVDEKVVYRSEKVFSNPSIDLAATITTTVMRGLHEISIIVNDRRLGAKKLNVEHDTYVGISKCGSSKVIFTVSYKPFIYD